MRFVSPPIGQALAGDALESFCGALIIGNAQPLAFIVPEIEFAEIAFQVLLADVLVHPGNPALEDREVVFDGVGVPEPAAHIFVDRMVDRP